MDLKKRRKEALIFKASIFYLIVSANCAATPKVVEPDSFLVKKSSKSPSEVVKDLKTLISKKGINFFYEVPHHQLAQPDDHLRFTHVLVFGNPKKGTKLMLCDQNIGYELPLRILVSVDGKGQTTISYVNPKTYALTYRMEKCIGVLEDIAKLLDELTNACL